MHDLKSDSHCTFPLILTPALFFSGVKQLMSVKNKIKPTIHSHEGLKKHNIF